MIKATAKHTVPSKGQSNELDIFLRGWKTLSVFSVIVLTFLIAYVHDVSISNFRIPKLLSRAFLTIK
jgi:hypothetical protein